MEILPFYESPQYLDNLIGMRTLDETDRLHFVHAECEHTEYKLPSCLDTIGQNILSYLD